MSTVSFKLDSYDDQPQNAVKNMDNFEYAAKHVDSGQENGILSVIYDNPTYVATFGTEPYILEPRTPHPTRANNEAQATFTARKEEWKDNRDQHNALDRAVAAAHVALVGSLSASALATILGSDGDLKTITLVELVTC